MSSCCPSACPLACLLLAHAPQLPVGQAPGAAVAELARAALSEKQSPQLAGAGDGHPPALSQWGGQESAEPMQGRAETSSEAASVHLSRQIFSFLGSSPLVFGTGEGSTAPMAEGGASVHPGPPLGAQGLALSRHPLMSAGYVDGSPLNHFLFGIWIRPQSFACDFRAPP